MRKLATTVVACALAVSVAACGGGSGDSSGVTTTTDVASADIPAFTNQCEQDVNAVVGDVLLNNTLDAVYAKWGKPTVLDVVIDGIYTELKPAFKVGMTAIGIKYMGEYAINVCRDNDVYNTVLKLEKGDSGYRDGCLDGKMPNVNETLKDCTEGVQATTTTTAG